MPFEPTLGGGVAARALLVDEPSYKAAILEAVGVLSGSRFNGGNLKGCKVLLFVFAPPLGLRSFAGSVSPILERICLSTLGGSGSLGDGRSPEVERLCRLLTSRPMLDLRAVKKGGCSNSPFGDS